MAYSLAFTLSTPTMSDHPWIPLSESKPTEKHANNDGQVLFRMKGYSMSLHWNHPPDEAMYWQMMADSPPDLAPCWQEIAERDFKALMKKEFPDPTVPNLLIESTLRKFYFHD